MAVCSAQLNYLVVPGIPRQNATVIEADKRDAGRAASTDPRDARVLECMTGYRLIGF
jgi:hypothetical protein